MCDAHFACPETGSSSDSDSAMSAANISERLIVDVLLSVTSPAGVRGPFKLQLTSPTTTGEPPESTCVIRLSGLDVLVERPIFGIDAFQAFLLATRVMIALIESYVKEGYVFDFLGPK